MRNLLALFAFLLLTFVGVGWYRDWFKFETKPSSDGQIDINVKVNKTKIKDDIHKGSERILNQGDGAKSSDTTNAVPTGK